MRIRSVARRRCDGSAGADPSVGVCAGRGQHLDSGLAACRLSGMEGWPRPRVPDGTSGGETAFPAPVRSELMVDTFAASKAAWIAAGQRASQLTLHLRQNAPRRARYACERSAKPASPSSGNHCNHLCAVCLLNLYVRLNAAMSRCPRPSVLNEFLHSSTDPESLQIILEVSTIGSDHTPTGLPLQVVGASSRCRARSSASDSRNPTGGTWISTSAIAYPTGSAGRPWLPAARPDLRQADPFPGQRPGSCGAERRDDANGPSRDPRYHLTEVLSKRHPNGSLPNPQNSQF